MQSELPMNGGVMKRVELGGSHEAAVTMNSPATTQGETGDFRGAERHYLRSLIVKERILGPDHPELAAILNGLAGLYERQERFTDSRHCHERALSILSKAC